jgi:DNA polymerase-3 subunit alpha
VGKGAIYSIISGRRDKGAFTGFVDFCQKINISEVNKRAIESLIKAGAYDSLGFKRAQLLNVYEKTMESIVNDRKRNIEGQVSFFSLGTEKTVTSRDDFPDIREFDKKYLLAMEKEMLGLYISGHPLDEYEDEIETQTNTKISEIIIHGDEESGENHYSFEDGQRVIVGGIVSSINIKATRKNDIMAFVNIEDMFGSIEVVVFPKVYQKCSRFISEDSVVLIKGRVSVREDEQPKILAEDIEPLRKGPVEMGKLFLRVEGAALNNKIKELKPLFEKYKGNCPVYLVLSETREKLTAPKDLWVTIDQKLLEELKNILGSENVKVG